MHINRMNGISYNAIVTLNGHCRSVAITFYDFFMIKEAGNIIGCNVSITLGYKHAIFLYIVVEYICI